MRSFKTLLFVVVCASACENHSHRLINSNSGLPKIAQQRIDSVEQNVSSIESIHEWTSIDTLSLEESTEGAQAIFFYSGELLKKIIKHEYGETYQETSTYYLAKSNLSCSYEVMYKYNRPIYYDSSSMKENNDTEVFDIAKSDTIVTQSYFYHDSLFQQSETKKNDSLPTEVLFVSEGERILSEFENLVRQHSKIK